MPKGLPHMLDRRAQALVEDSQDKDRKKRSAQPFDGNGRWHQNITVASSGTKVLHHGLGRVPRGYIVTRVRTAGTVDAWFAEHSRDEKSIEFGNPSSSDVTVDLWIF